MVEIMNITHHPKVILPRQVEIEQPVNARQFLMDLCDAHGVAQDLVMKRCILVDSERLRDDTIVEQNSRIYILQAPVGG